MVTLMFNEGPIPPDMMPGIRDLIADLEGYRTNAGKGDTMQREEDLNHLAILLMLSDQDEKITQLEEKTTNTSAGVGLLFLFSLMQVALIICLIVSR